MMHQSRNQIIQFFRRTEMKVGLVLLAVLACGLALPKYQTNEVHHDVKQQHVYDVLKYINNPLYHKEFLNIAQNFDVEANSQHYKNDVYEKFLDLLHHDGFLKKGEIFSIYNEEHMQQTKTLFELFYHADSYQIFHNTALWARHNLNEGVFVYAYCVAITHRPDTHSLVLPPIYEWHPHFFFNNEVLQQAYQLKMTHSGEGKQQKHYTIRGNYSGSYLNLDPEQSLSYYLEDVGLNAFYFYYNIHFPYWMKTDEYNLDYNRGELFYFLHKQLYARYHLERLSHGLGDVEDFNWDLPFKTGYYPSLAYTTGLPFPERPHFANLREYVHYYGQKMCERGQNAFDYTYVQTYEQRIREAIDSGFVLDHKGNKHHLYSEEGINILGNIIEGNADSQNYHYYGSYVNIARHLLGYAKHPLNHHKLAPSALEQHSTSLRDPAFYHIYKKVLNLIDQFKRNLPHYHQKHLYQTGLKIENVEFDELVTYYDHFLADITNGLFVTPEEYETNSFRVTVDQHRLNHKNFNYKIHVKADKAVKAAVRVYIGPKHDEHGRPLKLSDIHDKIFQIDYFAHDLKVGDNVITRNSDDSSWFIKDQPSIFESLDNEHSGIQHHFPQRFRLPRGTEAGLSFQVYVIVYPYVHTKNDHQHKVDELHMDNNNLPLSDSYPLGYPFDRPTAHEDAYHVPNSYVKHVKIYHRVNKDIWNENMDHENVDNEKNVDDVMIYQRGDHNNYNKYHYQVDHDDNDEVKHVKTNYVKEFLRGLTNKQPAAYKHDEELVYAPKYKNYQVPKYHETKTERLNEDLYQTNKLQYKHHDIYSGEDHGYHNYQKHEVDDDKYYGKNQKHVYGVDQDYAKYQKQGAYDDYQDYDYVNDQYHNTRGYGSQYGKVYGHEYTPYQSGEHMKYGYGDDYQTLKYQTGSEEHHSPVFHHY